MSLADFIDPRDRSYRDGLLRLKSWPTAGDGLAWWTSDRLCAIRCRRRDMVHVKDDLRIGGYSRIKVLTLRWAHDAVSFESVEFLSARYVGFKATCYAA